jgi:glycosyltransferase involved in cell wall biosynthesis
LIDILVDGRPLSASSATRGIGTYLRNTVRRLTEEPDIGFRALVTDADALPDGVQPVPIRRRFSNRLSFYEQSLLLPRDIARAGADLFFSPGTDPPRHCPVPWVQTLLDVIPVAFDHPKFEGERRRWKARGARVAAADAVIAISQHSASDGVRLLGLDEDRVHVVHLGVDPSFHPPAVRPEPDPPYLLYVSEYGPHKGFSEAFDVIARLADTGLPHRLKMVGKMGPRAEMRVRSLLDPTPHPERVDLLNRVSDDELQRLYHGASLLVVTSRYEGFGLPVLEAMASGTPVVSFDNSSLPEVVGPAGVLVPDGDVAAFAEACRSVLTSPDRAEAMVGAGLEWSARFTWDESAARHAEVFRSVARAGPRPG